MWLGKPAKYTCPCDCHQASNRGHLKIPCCQDCYVYHGISLRDFKNHIEPCLPEETE